MKDFDLLGILDAWLPGVRLYHIFERLPPEVLAISFGVEEKKEGTVVIVKDILTYSHINKHILLSQTRRLAAPLLHPSLLSLSGKQLHRDASRGMTQDLPRLLHLALMRTFPYELSQHEWMELLEKTPGFASFFIEDSDSIIRRDLVE